LYVTSAQVIAARAQFADAKLLVTDAVKHQRLSRRDIPAASTLELVFDNFKQPVM
jgi:hypothetical protein